VLIQGESGTGKGVLAAWLHYNGPRAEEAFVDLNCAGFSRELLETELFGHEKGAFTGAAASKAGLLEVAHQGTVFLDEIGDMDPSAQAKLLKVLEEKRFRRLGDVRERQVNVRLIAATHRDLRRLVREGRFREDLYYRINTIPLVIPPLRERKEDIPILARDFLELFASGRKLRLAPDAEKALQTYSWPGNIRELRNVLERASLLSDSDVIRRGDLRLEAVVMPSDGDADVNLTLAEVERRHIERVLVAVNGHVERAAVALNIPRSTLYQKIKDLQVAPSKI
jgi:transcriptional regulator with PAS, ATPase and Fis domain